VARKSIYRPENKVFAVLLRDVRLGVGLTQEQLASKLDVDQAFVSEAERGRRRLDTVQVMDWCLACDAALVEVMQAFLERLNNPDYLTPQELDGRRRRRVK
jgi:transcriptional regulator with XRE-family HTH domain